MGRTKTSTGTIPRKSDVRSLPVVTSNQLPQTKHGVQKLEEYLRMRLTQEIRNNEARRLEHVKLRKQLYMWCRFGRQIQLKPKVTPLGELKTMCAVRKEWAARRIEYKRFEEYGGDMPIVNGWPYDLMTLDGLVLNVAQPTAGATTECGKPTEFRKWPNHWGPLRPTVVHAVRHKPRRLASDICRRRLRRFGDKNARLSNR